MSVLSPGYSTLVATRSPNSKASAFLSTPQCSFGGTLNTRQWASCSDPI
ncbi:MAG: hypothetical protein KME27_27225 [Lyngbya sp. HA4199-MV5]|nr:hypothetical protein [Lyngbya sp. HA4199-MV5]